jgi:hypothetical protein
MTEPGDEFETFLKTRTVLPNGMSDDDKLEPPKGLDAIVLKEAREAIRARRVNQTRRWATPVALAATILLCLSILLNVGLNTNRPAPNLRRMTAATADNASPTAANPVNEGERREKAADGAPSGEAILPEAKIVEPRAPRPAVIAEAATPAPSESPRPHSSAVDKADALADRIGTPVQAMREAPSVAARGYTGTATAAPSPSTAAAPPPSAAAAAPPSGGPPAIPPSEQPVLAKRQAAAPPHPQDHPQDPKTWLQQIAALRAEGKTVQADAEMQRFRATFPAYPAKPGPSGPSEPPK